MIADTTCYSAHQSEELSDSSANAAQSSLSPSLQLGKNEPTPTAAMEEPMET